MGNFNVSSYSLYPRSKKLNLFVVYFNIIHTYNSYTVLNLPKLFCICGYLMLYVLCYTQGTTLCKILLSVNFCYGD